jgi:hypothetical protein
MVRRLRCLFAISMTFTGATSAAAAAAPEWFVNGKPLPVGVVLPVTTNGKLKMFLEDHDFRETVSKIKCTVSDAEKIQNTQSGGIDEITSWTFAGCTFKPSPCASGETPELVAEKLPWQSELRERTPITDNLLMSVSVRCSGKVFVALGGELGPKVGKSKLTFFPGEPLFSGGGHFYLLYVSGTDRLKGPAGAQKITAQ